MIRIKGISGDPKATNRSLLPRQDALSQTYIENVLVLDDCDRTRPDHGYRHERVTARPGQMPERQPGIIPRWFYLSVMGYASGTSGAVYSSSLMLTSNVLVKCLCDFPFFEKSFFKKFDLDDSEKNLNGFN